MTGFLVEIRVVPGTKYVRDELNIFEKKLVNLLHCCIKYLPVQLACTYWFRNSIQ
jgi:hypothetical protein